MQVQRSLTGFNEGRTTFTLSHPHVIVDKVLQSSNVALLTPAEELVEGGGGRALFSGIIKKKNVNDRLVVMVVVEKGKSSSHGSVGTLQVNCDDPMMTVALLDIIKKGITSSAPIHKS